MKKALSLILALVLCLSLCACGGREQAPQPQKPNSDIHATDSNVIATDSNAPNDNAELVDYFLPLLCGDWAIDSVPTYEGFPKSISIHSDQTAILDETECTWEYGSISDSEVNIRFLVEDEAISGRYFTLMLNENGSVSVSLWGCSFSKADN